ncbi:aldose 1-epimerase-like protein [Leptotrombidium deliense]|uniref:Aldose 1-epimerase n=1 Tax=Leptotrombidium deliense TaxID=299467 RepID=A0A443SDS5_9ACAR|nr:aldose 1-epimerase-like protein [Leptotrombidium deliense]
MASNRETFGETFLYTLSNQDESIIAKVMEFGATITQLKVKDKNGVFRDIVLGFDNFEGYLRKENPYFGATVGRFANRIAKSSFDLNGRQYKLNSNESNGNTLHGGFEGFSHKNWTHVSSRNDSVELQLLSMNEDEGFPGTVKVNVKFSVAENSLIIEYKASLINFDNEQLCTVINLTNHSYFNLNGFCNTDGNTVFNHEIIFNTSQYLETDEYQIPTGNVLNVHDYPHMDFTNKCLLKNKITERGKGFDDCYVIENDIKNYKITGGELKLIARVHSPLTGITMEYFTTEPGFQFYTMNKIAENITTKVTQTDLPQTINKHSGLCLESQRFPNACNENEWKPQCLLAGNETYKQKTVYRFSLQ